MAIVKDQIFSLAERYVENTSVSLFLTGKAGTGKTTFLRYIHEHTSKRHIVLAPTGIAAVNAEGATIHSFFSLPLCPYLPDLPEVKNEYSVTAGKRKFLSKHKVAIIRSLELLIIDEVSMVRADLLDAVDATLRFYRRSSLPFGGVQLLMIGDANQLSPVVTEDDRPYIEQVYPSPYFFASKALSRVEYVTLELQSVYRQSDPAFLEILNAVRDNRLTPELLRRLNSRVVDPTGTEDWIHLTTHNRQSNTINATRLEELPGSGRSFEAVIEGEFPQSMYPVDATLSLKKGARVMFTRNDPMGEFYNGRLGTVDSMREDSIGVRVESGELVVVQRMEWENLRYNVDEKTGDITQSVEGTFSQFPLRPAWAITVHKSQGLTFDRLVVDVGAAFAFGQVYVALSRSRSLEGIVLTSPIRPGLLKTDETVGEFNASFPNMDRVEGALPRYELMYLRDKLVECFDFSDLESSLRLLDALFKSHLSDSYPAQYMKLDKYYRSVLSMQDVAARFHQQISRILGDETVLQERVKKAAGYYLPILREISIGTFGGIEADSEEVRGNLSSILDDLRVDLDVHRATLEWVEKNGFDVRSYLKIKAKGIVGDSLKGSGGNSRTGKKAAKPSRPAPQDVMSLYSDHPHPKLVIRLIDWRLSKSVSLGTPPSKILRQKTLLDIADKAPRTRSALVSIPKFGILKWKKFGEEILSIVSSEMEKDKPAEGQTSPDREVASEPARMEKREEPADTSKGILSLFREGRSTRAISSALAIPETEVYRLLSFCVGAGSIDVHTLVSDNTIRTVREYLESHPAEKSAEKISEGLQHVIPSRDVEIVLQFLSSKGV